jgi:hypothetical protein
MEEQLETTMAERKRYRIAQRKQKPQDKPKRYHKDKETMPPKKLYRRRTAAEVLDCDIQMLKQLEKQGRLHPIRLNRLHVFYRSEEVEALARGE